MRIKLSAILRKLPKKRLLISLALALLLVVADYITANFTFPILNSADDYHITAFLSSLWAKRDRDNSFDSIFCVNMAMEKELVDIADDFGDPMGNAAVTRRDMLDTVVNLAREASAANILMDIRFSEGLKSPGDSALFADIMKTDGLVVSRHRESDFGETPAAIMPKTAMSDYRGLAGSGFSRYEYLQDDQPSVAAAIWRYVSGHEITRNGILYFDNGRLCYNCPFISFPTSAATGVSDNGDILFPYLRTQLLGAYTPDELKEMMKGKTVVIGDFDNDVHDTYVGSVPGPLLGYFAYRTLKRGDHLVKVFPQILLLTIYWMMIFSVLSPSLINLGRYNGKWMQLAALAAECVGYGGILALTDCMFFRIWHVNLLTALPANLIFLLLLARRVTATVNDNNISTVNDDNINTPHKHETNIDNIDSGSGNSTSRQCDGLPDPEVDHADDSDRQLQV